jgi:phenylpropionate dioxygenase-like ring-hydroxylating dioxygenase large terminal subunit
MEDLMGEADAVEMGVYGFRVNRAVVGTRSEGKISYADIIAADGDPVPPMLAPPKADFPPSVPISFDRFLKREFIDKEVEHIWKKCWQVACREEDIPNVGDRINYDIVEQSYIIVRTGLNEIKAYYNSCPHRGRALCDRKENSSNFRCPFHAWTWNLDGSLAWVPAHEDFPHVETRDYSLQEVKVARWGGNVFINPDPNAPPLEAALGVLPALYADCPQEDRYTLLHFRKKICSAT